MAACVNEFLGRAMCYIGKTELPTELYPVRPRSLHVCRKVMSFVEKQALKSDLGT
jgi:hypothetical protein